MGSTVVSSVAEDEVRVRELDRPGRGVRVAGAGSGDVAAVTVIQLLACRVVVHTVAVGVTAGAPENARDTGSAAAGSKVVVVVQGIAVGSIAAAVFPVVVGVAVTVAQAGI